MIFFCSEYWAANRGGRITGIGDPRSIEVYKLMGNKRVRLERIIQWEEEYQHTYPRLHFEITTYFGNLNKNRWKKVDKKYHLIPYKCTLKINKL